MYYYLYMIYFIISIFSTDIVKKPKETCRLNDNKLRRIYSSYDFQFSVFRAHLDYFGRSHRGHKSV